VVRRSWSSGGGESAGEATGKCAFPDPALLRDERHNVAPLVLLGRHKKLAPDNCYQLHTADNCYQLSTVINCYLLALDIC
jgi:hypothetical protein